MKHFTIVFVVALFAFVGNVSGQTKLEYWGTQNQDCFQKDRFFILYHFTYDHYTKANKVHIKRYNNFEVEGEGDGYIYYSDDSLTVTVKNSPNDTSYNVKSSFYPNGELKSRFRPINNIYETYKYTEDGRILDIYSFSNENCTDSVPRAHFHYYYTDTKLDSVVDYIYSKIYNKYIHNSKKELIYTSTGYIIVSGDYHMVSALTNQYNIIDRTEYFFDSKNRLIRCKEQTYTYRNDGYDIWVNLKISESYYFNDKGDLIRYIDNSFVTDYTYTYNTITSNDKVVANSDNIITKKGAFVIDSNVANKPYYIYGLDGRLVKNGIVNSGMNEIPINEGVYIISFNGTSKKMLVR